MKDTIINSEKNAIYYILSYKFIFFEKNMNCVICEIWK